MSTILRIELAETEGALTRLVGLVERRGFTISTLSKGAPADGGASVTLEVAAREGVRQIDVLMRQIARLFDVHDVFAPEMQPVSVQSHASGRPPCPPRN
ncbi:ACT domain-containing protein [Maricaulis sp.]|uniref:ACT domain-containing protein n=1 Tax=Maricaulis sp. TaxID=1486257 RepID=UPI0026226F53|nr:ACT domain-containing protein [Maricaulis sp.]